MKGHFVVSLIYALNVNEWKRVVSSGKFSLKKEAVYELFNQKRADIAITKSVITHFRVFYHSKMCCPVFNSLKEWKFTRLHLESR